MQHMKRTRNSKAAALPEAERVPGEVCKAPEASFHPERLLSSRRRPGSGRPILPLVCSPSPTSSFEDMSRATTSEATRPKSRGAPTTARRNWKRACIPKHSRPWSELQQRLFGGNEDVPGKTQAPCKTESRRHGASAQPRPRRLAEHEAARRSQIAVKGFITGLKSQSKGEYVAGESVKVDLQDDPIPDAAWSGKRPSIGLNPSLPRRSGSTVPATINNMLDETEVDAKEAQHMRLVATDRVHRIVDAMRVRKKRNSLQRKYQALPAEEKDFLETTFLRFDSDCSGSLGWHEVVACLQELGLSGSNQRETREIQRVCKEVIVLSKAVQEESVLIARRRDAQKALKLQHEASNLRDARSHERRGYGSFLTLGSKGALSRHLEDKDKLLAPGKDGKEVLSQPDTTQEAAGQDENGAQSPQPATEHEDKMLSFVKGHMPVPASSSPSMPVTKTSDTDSICNSDDESSVKSEEFNIGVEAETELVDIDGSGFDLYSFAVLLIPKVRARLAELQNNRTLRYFNAFDKSGNGLLSLGRCLDVGACLGLDRLLFQAKLDPKAEGAEKVIDYTEFQKAVLHTQEQIARKIRKAEAAIFDETGISWKLFSEFRPNISQIYHSFSKLSDDLPEGHLRTISFTNAQRCIRELGFMATTNCERRFIESLMYHDNDDGSIDDEEASERVFSFEDFLVCLKRVRTYFEKKRVEELQRVFDRLDKDRSGCLDVAEISVLLEELGCSPRNRKEQQELGQLIQSTDKDGNGVLEFQEFLHLIQCMEEKLAIIDYEEQLEYAMSKGFTEAEFADFRFAFEELDKDGGGSLSMSEFRKVFVLLNKYITDETFLGIFNTTDKDKSGEIEFREFVDFMKMLADAEGIFADFKERFPTTAADLDNSIVQMLLGHLNIPKAYIRSLKEEEHLSLFCASFALSGPDEDFAAKFGIESLEDFLNYAKLLAAETLSAQQV
eukprot:TRINITY_DN21789_c0_g1_i5.p1 TRINITY_DN21789_c0_g1~~TRINITY_DN21789_c0_g1_i5.p1  ORF type:complete len:954 (-),score=220.87 TRINITY_DN21789_c0_g1_i5:56-2917(-)